MDKGFNNNQPDIDLSEDAIQQQFVTYFKNKYCLKHHTPRWMIFHIPNEGQTNARLIPLGLYPGAADVQIIDPNNKSHFIELKAKGKKQKPNQIKFQDHCKQMKIPYYLADNIEDAIAIGEQIVREFAILK